MKYRVYVSQAKKPFSGADLEDLLKVSRRNNTQGGVTGLLIYRYNHDFGRGNFMQVLEGPKEALDPVWARICDDKRHHTVIILEEGETNTRMFADWSMGFRNFDEVYFDDHPGFAQLGSDAFWQKAQDNALPGAYDALCNFYEHS